MMKPDESTAQHAERIAREHPTGHLGPDATPEERGAALERVLILAEALRRPGPSEHLPAPSLHEFIASQSNQAPGVAGRLRAWLRSTASRRLHHRRRRTAEDVSEMRPSQHRR